MNDKQPSLFEDSQEWQIGSGIGGFVAYAGDVATESWNTPNAARKAAQDGKVSKKWYKDYLKILAWRKEVAR